MHQFSLRSFCLSVVTIWLLNEHMEGSTGYRSLLCILHSIDAMMDHLDWPSTFHMYDSQHESEKRCTGIRPLDECILCTFYLNSNHQKLTSQNQFEQVLVPFPFCCFLMEDLELRLLFWLPSSHESFQWYLLDHAQRYFSFWLLILTCRFVFTQDET